MTPALPPPTTPPGSDGSIVSWLVPIVTALALGIWRTIQVIRKERTSKSGHDGKVLISDVLMPDEDEQPLELSNNPEIAALQLQLQALEQRQEEMHAENGYLRRLAESNALAIMSLKKAKPDDGNSADPHY